MICQPILNTAQEGQQWLTSAMGGASSLGCIGCVNPQCMRFDPREITCGEVENFPKDQSSNVCAVDAMRWDFESDTPIIDTGKCINCGVCMRRCPIGAIYFDGTVKVNKDIIDKETRGTVDVATTTLQSQQIERLNNVRKSGILIEESDELFETIYEKLANIRSNYHNTVARNLTVSV